MKRSLGILAVGFFVAMFVVSPLQAQTGGGVVFPNIGTDIYKLDASSFYTEGCISPCSCPVRLYEELRGTFKIKLQRETPTKAKWIISNVNWLVTKVNEEIYVTGGGSLLRNNDRYELKLNLDFGGETINYESGIVSDVGDFPGNLSFNLAVPGATCFTSTFSIGATELTVGQIKNYGLQSGVYASGCGLDPNDNPPGCACPIQAQNLVGGFGIVSLGVSSVGFREFSLVNIDLAAASFTKPPIEQFEIGGDAIFRVSDPPECPPGPPCLIVLFKEAFGRFTFGDSGQTVPMSSERIIGGGEFPRIEIGVLDELPGCFGQSLFINALPQRPIRSGLTSGG